MLLPVSSQGVPQTPIPLISTTVWDLEPPGNGGDTEASVIVPTKDATTLSAYAARGQVSLVATAAPPPPAAIPEALSISQADQTTRSLDQTRALAVREGR